MCFEKLVASHLEQQIGLAFPGDLYQQAFSHVSRGGGLFVAVEALQPGSGATLGLSLEYLASAVELHRSALEKKGWPAAADLLLGDGLVALCLQLAGEQGHDALARTATWARGIFGQQDPRAYLLRCLRVEGLAGTYDRFALSGA